MKKIASLDLARGFTVLMIAPIHTVLVYSTLTVHHSWLGQILAFIAEGPGAQLFMMLMGVFFVFSPPKSGQSVCQRALTLLLLAYGLNVLKFVIPMLLHLLPDGLLADLDVHNDPAGMLQVFLTGDILHFAAFSLPILWLVTRLPHYHRQAVLLVLILIFLSPICWDLHSANPLFNYLLTLAGGQPPKAFFPLCPWLVYPLTGLSVGYYLKADPRFPIFSILGAIGIAFLLFGTWLNHRSGEISLSFYRTAPGDTLWHLGIVFTWLAAWQWLSRRVPTGWFFRLLGYLSRNITQVYVIQWVVICWLVPVFGYQRQGLLASLGCTALTSTITLWFSITLNLLRPGRARRGKNA